MPYHAWKCDPSAISGGVDISKVPWCHLLQKTVSQQGSQKLRQRLVSHEHTAYFSDLFLTHWIMAILSKGCKTDNFESYNFLKLTFTNIRGLRFFLNVNLSLNQTLLMLLLYVRQTWMTELILIISLWGVTFLSFVRILLLICILLQFMWKQFLLHGTISRKLCGLLLMFLTGFTWLSVLLLFPPSIIFVFIPGFWCYFIYHRWASFVFWRLYVHHRD